MDHANYEYNNGIMNNYSVIGLGTLCYYYDAPIFYLLCSRPLTHYAPIMLQNLMSVVHEQWMML